MSYFTQLVGIPTLFCFFPGLMDNSYDSHTRLYIQYIDTELQPKHATSRALSGIATQRLLRL